MDIGKFVFDLIYPPNCVLCGEYSEKQLLCEKCGEELEKYKVMSRVRRLESKRFMGAVDAVAPFLYKGDIAKLVVRNKKKKLIRDREFLIHYMVASAKMNFDFKRIDFVTYVPMKESKERLIGFNHTEILAKEFAKAMEIPVLHGILEMDENSKLQHGTTSKEERVSNAFKNIRASGNYSLAGKTIIIIDDICTSGSTILACAKAFYDMGAIRVIAITAATVDIT